MPDQPEIIEARDVWEQAYRDRFLTRYAETGTAEFGGYYPRVKNRAPVTGPGIDLSAARLMLISSAGAYLKDSQTPFDAPHPLGDYSIRVIPTAAPFESLAIAHEHYDHVYVEADPQVLMPQRYLEARVESGMIGALTGRFASFSGYHPDVGHTVDETLPALLDLLREEQATAALLVPA
jgi:D-proline reductase (dithiol) PrdB